MPDDPTRPADRPDDLRRGGEATVEWIARYLERLPELPVLSRAEPGDLLAALPESGPEHPRPLVDVLDDLDRLVLPGVTHWNHPRFFAYFSNTGSVPGILGAAIATALNPNGMLWRTSPAATELEQRVVAWLAEWLGLPRDLFGIINDTASTSTLVALAAARQATPGYDADRGVAALGRPLRVYASEQAHSSVEKAAMLLGLGRASVCKVDVDSRYAMRAERLAAAISRDREAGVQPFCVVATIGTTATTAVDPVDRIADVCAEQGLWLHVDAAYAGPAAIVPEMRALFAGWERADSIVLNPHKWLFTPMCSSVLYTRRPADLREAFALVPEYLRTDVGDARGGRAEEPVDYMNYGIQLGRPFRSLRLWMVLCAYGRAAIETVLRDHVAMARDLASTIDDDPDFERLAPTPFSTVCFRHRRGAGVTGDGADLAAIAPEEDEWASPNERVMETVNRSGEAFLSHARLRGRLTLRLAIGNLRTTPADVRRAWDAIRAAASAL